MLTDTLTAECPVCDAPMRDGELLSRSGVCARCAAANAEEMASTEDRDDESVRHCAMPSCVLGHNHDGAHIAVIGGRGFEFAASGASR